MEFYFTWIALWIILLMIEVFIETKDFFVLWLSAILVGWLIYFFPLNIVWNWSENVLILYSFIIFCLLSFSLIYVSRSNDLYRFIRFKEKIDETNPYQLVGQQMIVQNVEGFKVIYHYDRYWNILCEHKLQHWDTVLIESVEYDTFIVKKIM